MDKLQLFVLLFLIIVVPTSALVWASLQVPKQTNEDVDQPEGPKPL